MAENGFARLSSALEKRLELIADRAFYARDPDAHLEALRKVSTDILEIQQELPSDIDPMLRHYLDRRSYDKALAWLRAAR